MKLRFLGNSLRVRVNRNEVARLASGETLSERVEFQGNSSLVYNVRPEAAADPRAVFAQGRIEIGVPQALVLEWANGDEIGLYFSLSTGAEPLKISIEKDLECVEGPPEERDPFAYPRSLGKAC
jgi:hypothetical protein